MRKFICFLAIAAIIVLVCISPKSANAEAINHEITHPEYNEATVHCCAETVWSLFYELKGCPYMMKEVIGNPLLSGLYVCADTQDCLICASVLMFKLWQESDVWADTLGESEYADHLVEDVVYILHERTLLDEELLGEAREDNIQ